MQNFLVGLALAIQPWTTAALVGHEVEPPQHHSHRRHHEVESHIEQSPHGKQHGKHHVHVEHSVVHMLNRKRHHSEVEQNSNARELPSADDILANMDAKRALPEHGFSGKPVAHKNAETYTSDWRREFGPGAHGETSVREICAKYPDSSWCRKNGFHHHSRGFYKKNGGHSGDSQHSDSHYTKKNGGGGEHHSGGGSEGHSGGHGGGDSEDSHSGGGGDENGKHGKRGSHGEHGEKEWHEDVLPDDVNPFGSDSASSGSSGRSSLHGSHGANDGGHKSQGGSHGTNDGSHKSQGGHHGEHGAESSAHRANLRTLLALAAACQLLWAA